MALEEDMVGSGFRVGWVDDSACWGEDVECFVFCVQDGGEGCEGAEDVIEAVQNCLSRVSFAETKRGAERRG